MAITEAERKVKEVTVHLADYSKHEPQRQFVDCEAQRIIIRAGRRGGKTFGIAIKMVQRFLKGRRQSYGAPTVEQVEACWFEVCLALREPIEAGIFKKNEAEHTIEKPGTKQRIKCRTVWNADTMRGDYGDDLYFDEWQLSNEDAWEVVGMPMLIDNNGTATFIYTPPSLRSIGVSKAHDPRHAAKMFKMALTDKTGLWQAFHFTSLQNPYISQTALGILAGEMSAKTYRQEILAEDDDIELSWLVHSKFNEQLCRIKRFAIPFNWDVFSGHDFGPANPAALFGARVKLPLPIGAPPYMRHGDLVFFREYAPGPGFSTAQHVARFKEFATGYNVRRSRGGNLNSEDEIRQGYSREDWNILPPALEKKNTQIDRLINLEENNKLYFFDDMWMVYSELTNCLWKLKDGIITNEIDNEAIYHLTACLVAGTMITTDKGQVPIENISVGDMVLTRYGYRKVLVAGETGVKETVTADFSNGSKLTGTPEHPVFVQGKGFVPLTSLRYGDIMEVWKEKQLFIMGRSSIGIQNQQGVLTGSILSQERDTFIGLCGKMLMGKYLRGILSTTKMTIRLTMNYLTWNVREMDYICQTICKGKSATLNILPEYALLLGLPGENGLNRWKGKKTSGKDCGRMRNTIKQFVCGVAENIKQETLETFHFTSFVLKLVNQHAGETKNLMRKREYAPFAGTIIAPVDIPEVKPAQKDVVGLCVKPSRVTTVYNLSVEEIPEYYANGILVHNCLRYILSDPDFVPETIPKSGSNKIPVLRW